MRILANSGQVLDQALADGNVQDIKSFLNEISLMPDLPSDLKATLAQLQRDLPGMMEAAADKYVVDVDAIIAATRQACLAAKTEKERAPLEQEARDLEREQEKLAKQQEDLAREQGKASMEANRGLAALAGDALRNGLAVRVEPDGSRRKR